MDRGAAELQQDPPERLRPVIVPGRHGERTPFWTFTKTVRVTRYGRQRVVMVHETQDVRAAPRVLVPEALPGASGRGLATWSERWASEIFPECATQVPGLEAAQGRQEDAVTRHFRLRGVAPALIPRAPAAASTSQR